MCRRTKAACSLGSGSGLLALACAVLLGACGSSARGELWYAGTALCGFTHDQLGKSNSSYPAILVTSQSFSAFSDVAVDANGNVWAVGVGSNEVLRFPAGAVGRAGKATPDLVIRSAALQSPGNLVFDKNGNLWVANQQTDTGTGLSDFGSIIRFDRPQSLSGTQNLAPAVQIRTSSASDLFRLGAIAFDAAGSLWVTSFAGMLRFNDPQGRSGQVTVDPDAVIAISGYPNNVYFYAMAFDGSGALWAAAASGASLNSIMKFSNPGPLSGRSSPRPVVTIAGPGDILPAGGLAFDHNGNLWTANGAAILMYTRPDALSGDVDPAPAITLNVFNQASPSLNAHLIFHPRPVGFPVD